MGFGTVQPSALPKYLRELQDRNFLREDELFLDIGQLILSLSENSYLLFFRFLLDSNEQVLA
jgi:hypothetical protein